MEGGPGYKVVLKRLFKAPKIGKNSTFPSTFFLSFFLVFFGYIRVGNVRFGVPVRDLKVAFLAHFVHRAESSVRPERPQNGVNILLF